LWENLVAKRDLVLKNLDKTPAEMPKNFKSATSVCDLSGAEKDNTVNEMAKLRAELKFTKTQQLAAGAAVSEVQRTTSTAPRRRLRLQQRQAPQETQRKYQGTTSHPNGWERGPPISPRKEKRKEKKQKKKKENNEKKK
jgi:hypothetical protein